MTKKWFSASICLLLLFSRVPAFAQENSDRSLLATQFEIENVDIQTLDHLKLSARLYEPKIQAYPGKRPAIVFTNSWTLNEFEYEVPARYFADKGYIVLSYATRGFGASGGLVEVGGQNDVRDARTVLDWLEANTRVDVQNIGMAGVSYGGGISLLAAAQDPRVKTVVSMSGWGNLDHSLYGGDTIREVWLEILLKSGAIFGRLSPEIHSIVEKLKAGSHEEELRAWARLRSPEAYVDLLNARGTPIFVANSYGDALFPPMQMRGFYEKLSVPKKFYLDRGLHASSAIPGILGFQSAMWTEVEEWMNHWLMSSPQIPSTGVVFHTDDRDEVYNEFPRLRSQGFNLTALNGVRDVETGTSPMSGIQIRANEDSGATTGFPVLSDLWTTYLDRPPVKYIRNIKREHAAVWQSSKLEKDLKLRGSPRVNFFIGRHSSPVQIVAYLYEVDNFGKGTLVTHGVLTIRKAQNQMSAYGMDLGIIGYDLAKGKNLVLAIDTRDPLYTKPQEAAYEFGLIQADSAQTSLELPIVTP